MKHLLLVLTVSLLMSACSVFRYQADFIEPNPRADTRTRAIEFQDKKVYSFENGSIQFDNLFDMARLNECRQINDSLFHIRIRPENEPINASPWYAFRLISSGNPAIWIQLSYQNAKHRYHPKISSDRVSWEKLPEDQIKLLNHDSVALLHLTPITDTIWIAGQELTSSDDVYAWSEKLDLHQDVDLDVFGKSVLGKPLWKLDINKGRKRKKPIVVVLSRQHPPEVSGHLAMQSFVETILSDTELSESFLKKFRVIVIPMVNPDGVDLGHWRHNSGGVDLNRDWGNYHQPEIRQLADLIVREAKRNRSEVVLGIDFHSTQKDIFYTNDVDHNELLIKDFKNRWLEMIDEQIAGQRLIEEASATRPVATSKNWFFEQLRAESVTYEVGDHTPRDFIANKAAIAAIVMMEQLDQFNLYPNK